jgi:hypothetical protein
LKRIKKLLIISGTGRNTGKTTLAELVIRKFATSGINAVKITPHPHPESSALLLLTGSNDFTIYEEKDKTSGKDTSRMLAAGANHAYLIISGDNFLEEAFTALTTIINDDCPLICESPLLARLIKPDLLIVMEGNTESKKEIGEIAQMANIRLTLNELNASVADKIKLENGRWTI